MNAEGRRQRACVGLPWHCICFCKTVAHELGIFLGMTFGDHFPPFPSPFSLHLHECMAKERFKRAEGHCHSLKSIPLFTLEVVSKGRLRRIMTYYISYSCANCFPELEYSYDSNVQSSFKTLQKIWIGNNIYIGPFRKVVAWQRGKSRVGLSSIFFFQDLLVETYIEIWNFSPWVSLVYSNRSKHCTSRRINYRKKEFLFEDQAFVCFQFPFIWMLFKVLE